MKINWSNKQVKGVFFQQLNIGDTFKNAQGQGAVYMKVEVKHDVLSGGYTNGFGMLELATGRVFKPTQSKLILVDVEMNIDTSKPSIY